MARTKSVGSRDRLDRLYKDCCEQSDTFAGYPCNTDFDYSELFRFLDFPLNNVGDPFNPCSYHLHTREIEREVLQWFADLLHAPEGDWWGYVTNGGTEGNLYGLYLARELHPRGMVYFSQDTHYSVSKNLRLLRMPHIMIKSQLSGEIDYEDLRETLRIHRDVPPIVFANIGTTMKEGVDRVDLIQEMLDGLAIPSYYIHCDMALCGMTLPFIDGAPFFDFADGIHSLSISGHKFIGSPVPCGVALALKRNVDLIARSIEYVGTLDTTISGSRNGFSPLILWHAIKMKGKRGFRSEVARCIGNARYAVERFESVGWKAWRNPHSITVVLERPPARILDKWQLAVQESTAHVIVMPHIDREKIDALAEDLERCRNEAN
ncbi:histidine decarboxylase [Pelagicoccus mobilis]|uniref:Histidine decarboxylase n=1 Tax=Pelagicoccus mobilis TaxID=415221 RepID=A0A934RZI1_9BACT|nr:histidine decarboxylase [Pelagicoccus mobilis]MBK1879602.1 histidine decarboxylase [Pelagicoccus mobilis]